MKTSEELALHIYNVVCNGIDWNIPSLTTRSEISKLLDQVRDESVEECAVEVEGMSHDFIAETLRNLKSKGEPK